MAKVKETEETMGEGTEVAKTIQYFIKCKNDEFIIELPRSWKVTFATVNPASNHPGSGHCIRVYEMPGNHLRAVYDNALSIRDMSIPLARKVKSETGNSSWSKDSTGNFKQETEVKQDTKFISEGDKRPFDSVDYEYEIDPPGSFG